MDYKKFLSGINLDLNKQFKIQEDFAKEVATHFSNKRKGWEEEKAASEKQAYDDAIAARNQERLNRRFASSQERLKTRVEKEKQAAQQTQTQEPKPTGRMAAPLVWFRDKQSFTMQQYLTVRNLVLYDLGRPKQQQEAIPVFTAPQDKEQRAAEQRSKQTMATLKPLEPWFMEWLKAEAAKVEKARITNYVKKQDGTTNEIGIKQLRQWFLNYVGNKYNARVAKNPKNENKALSAAINAFSQKYEVNAPQPQGQAVAIGLHAPSPGTPDQIKQNALNGLAFGGGYTGNTPLKNAQIAQWWKEIQPYLNMFSDTKKALNFGIQYAGFKKGVEGVIDPTTQLQQDQSNQETAPAQPIKTESFLDKMYSQLA